MGSQVISPSVDPEASSDVRDVVDEIRQLVRALRLSSRAAEKATGLSSAQLFVLQMLGERPGISLGELADLTSTDPSSVSAVVQRLAADGLISRERAPNDARRLELRLSRKGRELLKKSPPMAQQHLIQSVYRLSSRDRKQLARSLGTMVQALDLPSSSPPMFFEDEEGDE